MSNSMNLKWKLIVLLKVTLCLAQTFPDLYITQTESPVGIGSSVTFTCFVIYDSHKFTVDLDKVILDFANDSRTKATTKFNNTTLVAIGNTQKRIVSNFTIDPVKCLHDNVTVKCTIDKIIEVGSNKVLTNVSTSHTLKVINDPEVPANLTFRPHQITTNEPVVFTCGGHVGKPPKNLQMFLQKRDTAYERIDLPIYESDRRNGYEHTLKCSTIQTVTASYTFDGNHQDFVVTCQVGNDSRYSRTSNLGLSKVVERKNEPGSGSNAILLVSVVIPMGVIIVVVSVLVAARKHNTDENDVFDDDELSFDTRMRRESTRRESQLRRGSMFYQDPRSRRDSTMNQRTPGSGESAFTKDSRSRRDSKISQKSISRRESTTNQKLQSRRESMANQKPRSRRDLLANQKPQSRRESKSSNEEATQLFSINE